MQTKKRSPHPLAVASAGLAAVVALGFAGVAVHGIGTPAAAATPTPWANSRFMPGHETPWQLVTGATPTQQAVVTTFPPEGVSPTIDFSANPSPTPAPRLPRPFVFVRDDAAFGRPTILLVPAGADIPIDDTFLGQRLDGDTWTNLPSLPTPEDLPQVSAGTLLPTDYPPLAEHLYTYRLCQQHLDGTPEACSDAVTAAVTITVPSQQGGQPSADN